MDGEIKLVSLADLMAGREEVVEFSGHKIAFTFNPNAITPSIHRQVEEQWGNLADGGSVASMMGAMAELLGHFVTKTGIEGVEPSQLDQVPSELVAAMFGRVVEVMRPNPESGETAAASSDTEAS
jgi:hypothetical protein